MGGGGISDRSAAFAIWPHTLKPINSYRPQPRFCILRNRGLFGMLGTSLNAVAAKWLSVWQIKPNSVVTT